MTEDRDREDRLPDRVGHGRHGLAAQLGSEHIRRPMVTIPSSKLLRAEQNGMDISATEVELLVRERLDQHPHFRGRTSLVAVEMAGETIVLSGRVPSYYLKQLLQEAVGPMPDGVNIDNQVEVAWPGS